MSPRSPARVLLALIAAAAVCAVAGLVLAAYRVVAESWRWTALGSFLEAERCAAPLVVTVPLVTATILRVRRRTSTWVALLCAAPALTHLLMLYGAARLGWRGQGGWLQALVRYPLGELTMSPYPPAARWVDHLTMAAMALGLAAAAALVATGALRAPRRPHAVIAAVGIGVAAMMVADSVSFHLSEIRQSMPRTESRTWQFGELVVGTVAVAFIAVAVEGFVMSVYPFARAGRAAASVLRAVRGVVLGTPLAVLLWDGRPGWLRRMLGEDHHVIFSSQTFTVGRWDGLADLLQNGAWMATQMMVILAALVAVLGQRAVGGDDTAVGVQTTV